MGLICLVAVGSIWLTAVAAVVFFALWWSFPVLARLLGALIVLYSLGTIAIFPDRAIPHRLWWLLAGTMLWLAGHWAWAFKHNVWASRTALRIFTLPGLHHLIPRSTLTTPAHPAT